MHSSIHCYSVTVYFVDTLTKMADSSCVTSTWVCGIHFVHTTTYLSLHNSLYDASNYILTLLTHVIYFTFQDGVCLCLNIHGYYSFYVNSRNSMDSWIQYIVIAVYYILLIHWPKCQTPHPCVTTTWVCGIQFVHTMTFICNFNN